MAEFTFDASGVHELARDLGRGGAIAWTRAHKLVQHYGMKLQAKVKANASGRPGPRIQTGDYNRSIGLITAFDRGGSSAQVGTNRPQGMRLERGFSGTDSLGRSYHAPPFPHFGPALDQVAPAFEKDVAEVMSKVWW